MSDLRAYLVANMFDDDDSGMHTQRVASLVDEVCFNVAVWMAEASGVQEMVDDYYEAPKS